MEATNKKIIETFKSKSDAILYAYKYAYLGTYELKRVFDYLIKNDICEMEHEVIIVDEFGLLD